MASTLLVLPFFLPLSFQTPSDSIMGQGLELGPEHNITELAAVGSFPCL